MRLRLDPWAAEYQTAFLADPGGPERRRVDVAVERAADAWEPLAPAAPPSPRELVFLDGSRRIDARVLLEDERAEVAFGALGCYGVGAVRVADGRAEYLDCWEIQPLCALSGGSRHPDFALEPRGARERGGMRFRVVASGERDVDAVVRELQKEMLAAEGRLAARLRDRHPDALVICDGPRPLLGDDARVLGYVKTIHDVKVPEAQLQMVRTLEAGERSPLYLVETDRAERQYFEWFLRLRDPRPWLYSLAGMVRLQAYAGADPAATVAAARALADWSCAWLPRFATRAHQDPRAPQQLLPIRALEAELGRRMGSSPLLRRRITRFLSEFDAPTRDPA